MDELVTGQLLSRLDRLESPEGYGVVLTGDELDIRVAVMLENNNGKRRISLVVLSSFASWPTSQEITLRKRPGPRKKTSCPVFDEVTTEKSLRALRSGFLRRAPLAAPVAELSGSSSSEASASIAAASRSESATV